MKPQARKDQMLAQEVGDELVVYDEQTSQAHRLNATAAMVWKLSDGQRTVDDVAAIVGDALDTQESADLVRLALAELEQAGLLTAGARSFHIGDILSRRQMLTAAASLLPVVASIVAPTPAMAFTPPPGFGFSSSSSSSGGIVINPSSSSSAPSSSSGTPSSSSSTPSSSSSSGPNYPSFNGTWTGSGTAIENGCGFSQLAALRAALGLDANGRGTYSKVHVGPNQTFAYTGVQAGPNGAVANSIRFVTTGTFNVGGTTYTVTDEITMTGNVLTGTQTFQSGSCRVVYQLTMSK